ncbi:hypothetical protein AY601_1941 [Pedobacter cryoconitis]|uniref:DUF3995 domain-containing protein n=1 Tax=Pedobacter cryoconitis TaxID=188932 RepID=A0A127VD42_9SPHI|nr:DUF3995 domain-containing protein [Pedobacter cryoconitis]AMP98848.1 hypothetical protein AY601_1941 [Pedobacter cryoconitis]
MINLLALWNAIIFIVLALLHFYWAFGGFWGKDVVVPTGKSGQKLFVPDVLSTLIVAIGLLIFALCNLSIKYLLVLPLNPLFLQYGILVIGLIFLVRAVGDFNYVGLMKKHKTSDFARRDSFFYSPLCLFFFLTHLLIFIGF